MQCKITLSLLCLFLVILPNVYPRRITWKQIQKATRIWKAISGKDLSSRLQIKDMNTDEGSYVKNIKITHVNIPRISIKGDWKKTIIVEASNIGLGMKADWRIKGKIWIIPYSESGTLKASVSNVKFRVTLNKNTFRVKSCSDSIGSTKVKLRGKLLAWIARQLFNLFNLDEQLKKQLNGKICRAVTKAINKQSSRISRIVKG